MPADPSPATQPDILLGSALDSPARNLIRWNNPQILEKDHANIAASLPTNSDTFTEKGTQFAFCPFLQTPPLLCANPRFSGTDSRLTNIPPPLATKDKPEQLAPRKHAPPQSVEDLSFSPRDLADHPAPSLPTSSSKRSRLDSSTVSSAHHSRRLDSVALQWKLGNQKIHSLPADALIKAFDDETARFRSYSLKTCAKLSTKLRSAFEITENDPVRLATIKAIDDPLVLRNEWLAFLRSARKSIRRRESAAHKFGRDSVVGKLVGYIKTPPAPPKMPKHPRGAIRVSSSKARKSVTFDVSSSSDKESGEYSVSSSDDDAAPAQKRQRNQHRGPITVDDSTKLHLRAIKSAKHVREYPSAAVDWIANTFVNGSTHIRQIVAGRHKDLDWSRSQLARVGERIIALYDKVALRERMGDKISAEAKKALLKSEFSDFANVRLSLHAIRLGEAGAGTFHQQVEDEDARADFELSSGNPRAFKIFSKQLSNVQKMNASSSKRASTPRRPRGRSTSSTNRSRRTSRPSRSGNRRRNPSRFRSRSRDRSRGNQTPRRRPPPRPSKSGPQSNQA